MSYARVQEKRRKMDVKCISLFIFNLFYISCGLHEVNKYRNEINQGENDGNKLSKGMNSENKTDEVKLLPGRGLFPRPIEIIVGGGSVAIERVPYTVSLQYKGKHSCGGAILRNDLILTAAHCLIGYSLENLSVRAGSISTTIDGTVANIRAMLVYPEYNRVTKNGDIGLAWLDRILAYSDVIKPIDMIAEGQEIEEGTIAYVTGWGFISENGTFPQSLQGVEVPIMTAAMCKQSYGEEKILPTMLCAGRIAGGQDACTYDSGGPLVHNHKLIGIVSWGRGCARPDFPGVYAKISALRTWIDDNMMLRPV